MGKVVPLSDIHARPARLGRRNKSGHTCVDLSFPSALANWIRTHRELIDALCALRHLGDDGREAIDAISALRRVATARDSWSLWEVLCEGDGEDPEALLLEDVLPSELESARRALWGPRWDDQLDPTPTDWRSERAK